MVRYLGWLANTALFTLCCFLVANTANAIIAALLSQSPALAVELRPRSGPQSRTWNDRQQITQRNLKCRMDVKLRLLNCKQPLLDMKGADDNRQRL